MTGAPIGRILRTPERNAKTAWKATVVHAFVACLTVVATPFLLAAPARADTPVDNPLEISDLQGIRWDFSRSTDQDFNDWPDGWQRHKGIGYPQYVSCLIAAKDPDLEKQLLKIDTALVRGWAAVRQQFPSLPALPPAVTDSMIDRYLRVDLDGGQVKVQTTRVRVSRLYQYRFTCRIMTQGLRYDTARAELVFLDKQGQEISSHPTASVGGTSNWIPVEVDRLQPPPGSETVLVRLVVQSGEDGIEDIDGTIGFDDLWIEQYPQLQVATNEPLGIYVEGQPIEATARVMGLPLGASKVRFRLYSSDNEELADRLQSVANLKPKRGEPKRPGNSVNTELSWRLPRLQPGFYRVTAALEGDQTSTLATETTLAVISKLVSGPPHGSFGWTLPEGSKGISPRDLAPWLARLGVAWVKYPCWLAPEDYAAAEQVATIFSKLQDAGVQTVGMLDVPPEEQLPNYNLRGRRDMVAAQLFRDVSTWQSLLEPVMTRLTLKVRTWQLGADRDHSFLGRSRLRDSIKQISTGLQGFGQPIDVAISWPWMEAQLGPGESSWQAICRSSDPPLGANELDAFLTLNEVGTRGEGPRTWLLLDPIAKSRYDRRSRIQDMVLRMATVRSHRVQAAFVSNPCDPERGLLRPDGRPDELLLPWRTTSRLIGNLRYVGSLQLRSGAENAVFAGGDRAVLMVWGASATEELMYLGENVQQVDVWGNIRQLRNERHQGQTVQRVKVDPLPSFIVGADPTLLAFRMSVVLDRNHLDSLLGQVQKLSVSFTNPTRDSLIGDMQLLTPDSWNIESPRRSWETLGGRGAQQSFNVVLGNSAKIGPYELPIRFEIQDVRTRRFTVYRWVKVGPEGLDLKVDTRLTADGDLRVQIELTNRTLRTQSYDCMLFPLGGRQYQRKFITVRPNETVRRDIYWVDAEDLVGGKMLLRAVDQDGRRVVNYSFDVTK